MKWVQRKIEAASIQYVLVISVIIIIVLSAFVSLLYLQKRIAQKSTLFKETVSHTNQAFDYIAQAAIPYNTVTDLSFSEYPSETTKVERTHWGIFDLISVTATLNNEQFQKIGIVGGKSTRRTAMYLQDTNKPLVLVGDTQIKGNVFLPRLSVKPGSIGGTSYYGSSLIYGNTAQSSTSLPGVQNIKFLGAFIKDKPFSDYEEFELEDGIQRRRSFAQSTQVHISLDSLYLQNISLKGNIIVASEVAITVHPSALLEHVLLVAPKIVVLPKTKGTFQALASQEIQVAEQCDLGYPSALIVAESRSQNRGKDKEAIKIGENSRLKGVVVYDTEKKPFDYDIQVSIGEGTVITGEVYCKKNLELKGSVKGSVFTGNFIAREYGSVYVNHIYNGLIDGDAVTDQLSGLFMNRTTISVAKWVH
ncbi:hypothetical protein RQM59_02495 [Flavobacteriaceae bacterium S356]|uniref:Polymer-forming cytoskeletal protein n=1 Tax=Asprobacillus argus TaxID=3076534 RepID=A0ABU3LCA8_9FLAO|nr:hypothetical protein [Flavobacteriaceae bacterium S356]